MIYLLPAQGNTKARAATKGNEQFGIMQTPVSGRRPTLLADYAWWAADNGCYTQGDRFDAGVWLAWLDSLPLRERCLFATAPDVVGDAAATLARSAPYLPRLRAMGYRAALVAQNGLTPAAVPWRAIDALFLGGTTEWKLSPAAETLAHEARRLGKWLHVGRVNTLRRLHIAKRYGAGSVDGTFLKYAPDEHCRMLVRWLGQVNAQLPLLT